MADVVFWLLLAAAAAIDARERRFPNGLAVACAVVALAVAWTHGGFGTAFSHAFAALVICGVLVAFELVWRNVRHVAGLGMGDIKALFSLAVVDPMGSVYALALGLLALVLACLATKSRSLPLLPFLVGGFAIIEMCL